MPPVAPPESPRPWLCALAMAILAAGLYAGSLWSPFLYDSELQIDTCDYLHDPHNLIDVLTLRVLAQDILDFNRPVQLASLMLDAMLYGKNPFGYHLTGILLHALCTLLVFAVARSVGRASGRPFPPLAALLGAALFALHPVQVEAVCEPGFREDLLVAGFGLLALLFALRADPARPLPFAAAAGACAFLAAGAKESAVCIPFLIGAALWLVPGEKHTRKRWILALVPLVATGCFFALRFGLAPKESVIFTGKPTYPGDSFSGMLAVAPRIMAAYLRNLFWPTQLSADYGLIDLADLPLGLALWMLGLTVAGVLWWAWADRRVAMAACLVALPLIPVSNLLPIYRPMADRYLYFPMAGAALFLACLLAARARSSLRAAAVCAALAWLGALIPIQWERQQVWSDELQLWAGTVADTPTSYNAALGSAWAYWNRSDMESAVRWFEKAHQLARGKNGDPLAGGAMALERLRRFEDADRLFAQAVGLKPLLAEPHKLAERLQWETEDAECLAHFLRRHRARRADGVEEKRKSESEKRNGG